MAPGRKDGLLGLTAAVGRLAACANWLTSPLAKPSARKSKSLHLEPLEDRLVWSTSVPGGLVAPEWFEDYSSAFSVAHTGSAGWSATAEDQQRLSVSGSADSFDWIVRFDTAALEGITSAAGTAGLLAGSGFRFDVIRGLGMVGQVLVRSSGASLETVQDWLLSNEAIAGFERDALQQFARLPNDPRMPELWGLENAARDADIDAAAAWDFTTGSRSVVVAVVDTGVDYTHPDLAANIWTNPGEIPGNGIDDDRNGFVDDVHGYNFAYNTANPMDDQGHGTHVSGTIAAVGNNGTGVAGINWSGSVMALKFLDSTGSGYTSDALRAINYATMMRTRYGVNVRVMNHSWGGGGTSQALRDAIQASGQAGILNVVAAGNNASDNDSRPVYPASYDCPNIIAVAATDNRDNLASFSNYGATSVDLAAPGVGILSTVPGASYASYSGTSMAAPHASGVAALAWALLPDATVAEVRNAILQGADRLAGLSGRVATGGRLNAANTLQLLNPSAPQAPSISSLLVTPNSMTVGAMATLTASGVVDRDGIVAGVWFYQDTNANGQWDTGDRLLGADTTVQNGTASLALDTTGYAAGSYTLFARAQDNQGQWSPAVSATMQLVAPDDHGNDFTTATRVVVPGVVSGLIGTSGDQDWFAFQATAGRSYVFQTTLVTLADSVLWLFDQDGTTLLASNDDWGTSWASRIAWRAPASGTYYVAVAAYGSWHTGSYRLSLQADNGPPILQPVPDQTMSYRQDTLSVPLQASDPDGDPLSFSASAWTIDPLAQRAYDLDRQLGLTFVGSYFQNARGLREKWMRGGGGTGPWYCILPNGELRRRTGSTRTMPLVATLSPAYWGNPRLLHHAQPPAPVRAPGLSLSFSGNVLVIDPPSGYTGTFYVQVTASDGAAAASRTFRVWVTNSAPSLAPIGPCTIQTGQDAISMELRATDADADRLTYTAQVMPPDPVAQRAFDLDQRLGLYWTGDYYRNLRGYQEKWVRGARGQWYCILPNGQVRRWAGRMARSPVVATLSPAYYADPRLLHDARLIPPSDVVLALEGTTLTINPRAGLEGNFHVRVTASDGLLADSETLQVTVASPAGPMGVFTTLEAPPGALLAAQAVDRIIRYGVLFAPGLADREHSLGELARSAAFPSGRPASEPAVPGLDRFEQTDQPGPRAQGEISRLSAFQIPAQFVWRQDLYLAESADRRTAAPRAETGTAKDRHDGQTKARDKVLALLDDVRSMLSGQTASEEFVEVPGQVLAGP
ncbi:MAG: S8 family serine peptidase [Thermoguttaceae bacterium]